MVMWSCGEHLCANSRYEKSEHLCANSGYEKSDWSSILNYHYKDTMENLILLTDFNARDKIQQICYERMNLMAVRSMVNKFRTFRQLNPDVVKVIWQLKIPKRRKEEEEEVVLRWLLGMHQASDMQIFQI